MMFLLGFLLFGLSLHVVSPSWASPPRQSCSISRLPFPLPLRIIQSHLILSYLDHLDWALQYYGIAVNRAPAAGARETLLDLGRSGESLHRASWGWTHASCIMPSAKESGIREKHAETRTTTAARHYGFRREKNPRCPGKKKGGGGQIPRGGNSWFWSGVEWSGVWSWINPTFSILPPPSPAPHVFFDVDDNGRK